MSQQDPARTVQTFIDLIQRHEQSFYSFVHKVHSKGEGLFDSLMRWIEQFLTLMREGLGEPISLEFLLPHTGQERLEIMKEVDAVARYHYLLKVAYEDKVRRRFGRSQGQSKADAEDEAATELVNGVVSDLSFGDLVQGDADELVAEASDDDDEEDSSSDEEEESDEESGSDESNDSEEESGSGSEESEGGSSTEGGTTRGATPTPSVARSQTLDSPASQRSHYSPGPKQSLDLPTPSRPPPPRTRSSRSMSLSHVAAPSSSKELPQLPQSARLPETDRYPAASEAPAPAKAKKKKPEGPKPPELHHIPQLLPLFVEMVRRIQLLYGCDGWLMGS